MNKSYFKYIFPLAVALITTLLTAFRISGTSTGMYNILFYGSKFHDPNLLFGQPRSVRSDEWIVQTPWMMAQAQISFMPDNRLYVAGQNLTTMNVPVANWVMIFKPWLWPYFLLPLEYGLALSWWLRSAILLLITYVLLMKISRQNIFLSALGALAFLYSPYFQWWYASTAGLVDGASYGLLTFYFFIRTFRGTKIPRLAIDTLLFVYFALCFAFILYPPAQIPIALSCVFVGVGIIFADREYLNHTNIKRAEVVFGIAGIIILIVLIAFYFDFNGIITIIRHTVYPGGRRTVMGGDVTLLRLISGFYDVFLLRGAPPDILGPNQSAASSFFMFSIFLVPVFLFGLVRSSIKDRKIDMILPAAIVFFLLALSWMLLGLPAPLAKILLLQFVPTQRTWLAVGMVNFFLFYYYIFRYEFQISRDFKIFAWIYSIAMFFIILYIGLALKMAAPDFIHNYVEIVVISTISAVMLLLLLIKRKYEFTLLLLLFTLASTFQVNPFYVGLSPILNGEFSAAIQRINNKDARRSVWVVYDYDFGNYLAANGVKTISGVYAYPNLEFWKQLDPTERYVSVYNRFSHTFFSARTGNSIRFDLLPTGAAIQIAVNPCHPLLRSLNVNYYVFFAPVNETCLRQIDLVNYPDLPIYIYQRVE